MRVLVYEVINGQYCLQARFCKVEDAFIYKEIKQKYTLNPIVIAKVETL